MSLSIDRILRPARLGQRVVIRSRHPDKYPKLESSTLSDLEFEPLTEHHALERACSKEHECPVDTHCFINADSITN